MHSCLHRTLHGQAEQVVLSKLERGRSELASKVSENRTAVICRSFALLTSWRGIRTAFNAKDRPRQRPWFAVTRQLCLSCLIELHRASDCFCFGVDQNSVCHLNDFCLVNACAMTPKEMSSGQHRSGRTIGCKCARASQSALFMSLIDFARRSGAAWFQGRCSTCLAPAQRFV